MLISQNVKNIVSGISQQAPILRLPEQLEAQENGLSTEANGLVKRPPSVFVRSIMPELNEGDDPLIHFVDRDEKEKYFIYFYHDEIVVVDIEGDVHPVVYNADKSYIKTSRPQDALRVITVADHTFIVNRYIPVQMRADKTPNKFMSQGALIHVRQGQYGRTYSIAVNGVEVARHETPDGSDKSHTTQIDVDYIVDKLATQAREKGYTVDTGSAWLRIRGVERVATRDGFNNQAMFGFVRNAQKFSLLPATAPDGYTLSIMGDPNNGGEGSYYVSYNEAEKVWKECAKPDILLGLAPHTMPHELVRQPNGSFSFQRCAWADRKVGDDDSNPLPSFVGHTISDISFHRNRLIFLSEENVICSESAEYFNFWMTTSGDILDTDPIDVSTTTERVNLLTYAIPFGGELYCFSDKSQFVLRSDTVLSPKNTALVEVTGFTSNTSCRPVRAGRNLYFAADRSEYTSIKEYYSVQQVSEEKNAQDITSHVPDYIPNGVYQITPNTNENILLVLTKGDKTSMYVYKYLFINEARVQASWSRWTFGGRIFGAYFAGSTLYIFLNRGGRHCMEKIAFTTYKTPDFSTEPYRVYLDSKKIATTAVYNDETKSTSFNIVREFGLTNTAGISSVGVVFPSGKYQEAIVSHGHIIISGEHSTERIIIGFPYRTHLRLSPIFIHVEKNEKTETSLTGRLQLRYIRLNYANTGGFMVSVRYVGGRKCQYVMTARDITKEQTILGHVPTDTGVFKFPIQAQNTDVTIDIDSALPLPLSLIGFLWEGSYVQRSKGV